MLRALASLSSGHSGAQRRPNLFAPSKRTAEIQRQRKLKCPKRAQPYSPARGIVKQRARRTPVPDRQAATAVIGYKKTVDMSDDHGKRGGSMTARGRRLLIIIATILMASGAALVSLYTYLGIGGQWSMGVVAVAVVLLVVWMAYDVEARRRDAE